MGAAPPDRPGRPTLVSRVLFVCVHNAGRSQMSQALFERAANGRHEARSAGTEPADHVHRSVVTVMLEQGIDLSRRKPRILTDELARWSDIVITMGCGDACPVIPGKKYIDWELRDPTDVPIDDVRAIRDNIKSRVEGLVKDLDRAVIRG
ncbi:MAG: arsenate reductase ArsC [Chloroflexi bacterium]|nr:MAG: arsenate reductase ArsC [Chloroflexota bacterium]